MISTYIFATFVAFFVYRLIKNWITAKSHDQKDADAKVTTEPESVNFHFTRVCNYSCGFCFHTAKTSFLLPIEEAKRGLKMLADAGIYVLLVNLNSRLTSAGFTL